MRITIALALALPLYAATPPPGEVALGVGATDSNHIIVRLAGKEMPITLAGAKGGSEPAATFLRCLVEKRVVRISGPHSAAKVTLLDGSSVASHLTEYLSSATSTDPCALGKAAYQPQVPHAPVAPLPTVKRKSPTAAAPTKKGGHVSFGSGTLQPVPAAPMTMQPAPATPRSAPTARPAAQPAPYSTQPQPADDATEPIAPTAPPPPPPAS